MDFDRCGIGLRIGVTGSGGREIPKSGSGEKTSGVLSRFGSGGGKWKGQVVEFDRIRKNEKIRIRAAVKVRKKKPGKTIPGRGWGIGVF